MDKTERIFVAGHRGLAGSALVRALQAKGFKNLVTRDRTQLDLMDEVAVTSFFSQERPAIVIFAAARVGGIKANNDLPVEFLIENLRISKFSIRIWTGRSLFALIPPTRAAAKFHDRRSFLREKAGHGQPRASDQAACDRA